MSKKGLKKIGGALKKFTKSKIGKIVMVGAGVGASLALGGAPAAGLLAKGGAGAGKKLLGKLGSLKKIKAAKKGLTAGDSGTATPKKGLFSVFKKKGKGIGSQRIDEDEKASLLSDATATIEKKLKRKKSKTPAEAKQLDELAASVDTESKKLGADFNESVNGDNIRSMSSDMPTSSITAKEASARGSVGDEAKIPDPSSKGDNSDMLKKGAIALGGLGLLYGIGKATGMIK